jgi:hypothetical protein
MPTVLRANGKSFDVDAFLKKSKGVEEADGVFRC